MGAHSSHQNQKLNTDLRLNLLKTITNFTKWNKNISSIWFKKLRILELMSFFANGVSMMKQIISLCIMISQLSDGLVVSKLNSSLLPQVLELYLDSRKLQQINWVRLVILKK